LRDRKKRKGHIRAAKEWLGAAEHSLDSEDDVQSDLKLMLAKAELSQVQESERTSRLKTWGRRLAPLLVAVLLSAGLFSFVHVQHASVERAEQSNPVPASSAAVQPVSAQTPQTPEPAAATDSPAQAEMAQPMQTAGQGVPVQREQSAVQGSAQPRAEVQEAPVPAAQPASKVTVPNPEKQQLMQKAGQILRQ